MELPGVRSQIECHSSCGGRKTRCVCDSSTAVAQTLTQASESRTPKLSCIARVLCCATVCYSVARATAGTCVADEAGSCGVSTGAAIKSRPSMNCTKRTSAVADRHANTWQQSLPSLSLHGMRVIACTARLGRMRCNESSNVLAKKGSMLPPPLGSAETAAGPAHKWASALPPSTTESDSYRLIYSIYRYR